MQEFIGQEEGVRHDVVLQTEALTAYYDSEHRSLWHVMHAVPRPCFSEALLADIKTLHRLIRQGELDVDFYVQMSSVPGVFNLGGDLSVFRQCVLDQDWVRLTHYATICVEVLNDLVEGFDRQVICTSLIQGDALGGGFESALAADFMVAEQEAKLGFPEVLFNLFPGMGAYSFLARKLGPQPAQRMILSGQFYSAVELHQKGVIDMIAPPGHGLKMVENFIRDTRKHLRGYKSFLQARRRASFWLRKDELTQIVMEWVEGVKQTSERDLKLMDRLVSAQSRLKAIAA